MAKLQTMPLRFRFFADNELMGWHEVTTCEGYTIGLTSAGAPILIGASKKDLAFWQPKIDKLVISQDTGLLDRKGEYIFTGDLVSIANGKKPLFAISYEDGEIILRLKDGSFGGRALLVNDSLEVVGNIWEGTK